MHNLGKKADFFLFFTVLLVVFGTSVSAFQGGGGGIFFGTGTPSSIDAVEDLSDQLGITEEEGNFNAGAFGFFQGDNYRMGASFQFHVWAGWNVGNDDAEDDTAGLAAVTGGFYGTYTFSKNRLLLNLGGTIGAGTIALGYNLGQESGDISNSESLSTLYLEPQISVGIATCRWVGVEFQLSSPIFIFDEDLTLYVRGQEFTVKSGDMAGISFSIKLLFGRIADL